jgi:methionyl-tRNA formyltransferase
VGPVEPRQDAPELAPGELSVGPGGVLAGTGRGAVRLGQVQPAGRTMVAAADWARGARPAAGERLGA